MGKLGLIVIGIAIGVAIARVGGSWEPVDPSSRPVTRTYVQGMTVR